MLSPEGTGVRPVRTIELGSVTVDLMQIGVFRSDAGAIFGPVPRTTWEPLVRSEIDDESRLLQALNILQIRTPAASLLLETGTAPAGERFETSELCSVSAREAIVASGFDPGRIEYVVPSHLHRDHAGGLTQDDGRAAFPRAAIVAPQAEISAVASTSARARAAYDVPRLTRLFVESPPEVFLDRRQLLPEVELRLLGGHTLGSQATVIRGRDRTLLFMGDLFMRPWQANPRWVTAYDDEAWTSVEAKGSIFAEAAAQNWLIVLSHELDEPLCRLEADGDRFRLIPE